MNFQFLNFSDIHPAGKLAFAIMLMFISYLVLSFIGILISIPVFQLHPNDAFNMLSGGLPQGRADIIKFHQIFQSTGLFIVPAVLLNFLYRRQMPYLFNYRLLADGKQILLVAILLLVSLPFMESLIYWNANLHLPASMSGVEEWMVNLEAMAQELTKRLLLGTKPTDLLMNLLVIAIIPAIGEEFFFRGIIQKLISEWTKNNTIAIICAAAFFSFFHFQFFGFVPRLAFGILFGFIFLWTQSIWYAVLAHFINNALAVCMFFAMNKGIITSEPDQISQLLIANNWLIGASVIASIIFMYLIRQRSGYHKR